MERQFVLIPEGISVKWLGVLLMILGESLASKGYYQLRVGQLQERLGRVQRPPLWHQLVPAVIFNKITNFHRETPDLVWLGCMLMSIGFNLTFPFWYPIGVAIGLKPRQRGGGNTVQTIDKDKIQELNNLLNRYDVDSTKLNFCIDTSKLLEHSEIIEEINKIFKPNEILDTILLMLKNDTISKELQETFKNLPVKNTPNARRRTRKNRR
jgi:hypothetical protein